MQAVGRPIRTFGANLELVGLLLASIACIVFLTATLAHERVTEIAGLEPRHLLLVALLFGAAALAAGLVWITTRNARRVVARAEEETRSLRARLVLAEAIIKGEPQVLVAWEPGHGLSVMTHTLEGVAGLPPDKAELLRFGSWLEPAGADALKAGLDGLFRSGDPFRLLLRTSAGGHLEADGRAAGARAVLRLRDVAAYKNDLVKVLDQHQQLTRDVTTNRALLDTIPIPAWVKDADGHITWVNHAYVEAVEAKDMAEVLARQVELLDTNQRSTAAKALAKDGRYAKRMPLVIGGERKAHDVVMRGTPPLTTAIALDVSAIEKAQGELDRQITSYDRTLDRVRTGVAIFDRQRRLTFYNDAYQKTWLLDANWLDTKPTSGELLDRLRELSRLPAMADYREWKASVLAPQASGQSYEDWWQLPDGRLVHVTAEHRHDGGIAYLYDDATERIALESRYNELTSVQRETLDSLKEGVAVFATDGRLKLYNTAFAAIWRLSREMLDRQPHIAEVVKQASVLYDDAKVWQRMLRAITAVTDERDTLEGQMVRPDLSVIDFATTPLPDGATLITYADVTASKRYERALEERNEALIAGDKLKNDFIGHVSYELRTPLTNIIGFSELLASPRTGPLIAQAARVPGRYFRLVDDIAVDHRRHPRSRHHRRRRPGAEARPRQRPIDHRRGDPGRA